MMLASTAPDRRSAPECKAATPAAINTPPPRNPNVNAAPTDPIKLKTGVPTSRLINRTRASLFPDQTVARPAAQPVPAALLRRSSAPKPSPAPPETAAAASTATVPAFRPDGRSQTSRFSESIDASSAATQIIPGAIDRNNCVSGPIPSGNRLTTIIKKKTVDSMSARRRHASVRSRQTIQRNIDKLEGEFTLRVRVARSSRFSAPDPGASLRSRCRRLPGALQSKI